MRRRRRSMVQRLVENQSLFTGLWAPLNVLIYATGGHAGAAE